MRSKIYFALLSLLSIIGLWSFYIRFTEGMKVTALTSYSPWGLWIVFYIYFIGLSAGSFLLSTMVYVFNMKQFEKIGKLALFTAFFSLLAGLLFVLIDLGHPERFWHALVYRQANSVLSWEIQFYLIYMVLILAEIWFLMREEFSLKAGYSTGLKRFANKVFSLGYQIPKEQAELEQHRKSSHKWMRILGIVGIPTALGVHGGTGSLFGVVMAKSYWFSGLTPIIFLVSALVSGAALMIFLYSFFSNPQEKNDALAKDLSNLLVLFIGIDVILMISEFLIGLYNPIPEERMVFMNILFSNRWYIFWLGQIGLVVILPIILLAKSKQLTKMRGLAGLSVIIGIVSVRWTLIVPAFTVPQLVGLDKAFTGSRLVYSYTPNSIEWLSSIGIIAIVTLLFSLTTKLIPIFDNKGVKEYHGKAIEGEPHYQA
ncbi:MAG: NrfD/PsrC family molybdoenzyme membrane anchor subunit [Tepidibacillus sp.]